MNNILLLNSNKLLYFGKTKAWIIQLNVGN